MGGREDALTGEAQEIRCNIAWPDISEHGSLFRADEFVPAGIYLRGVAVDLANFGDTRPGIEDPIYPVTPKFTVPVYSISVRPGQIASIALRDPLGRAVPR